jgi:uncharacterized repeat protein (TIGR02543 family)
MISRIHFIYASIISLFLITACGSSIKTSQDFIPNKAPILDDTVTITDTSGSQIDETRLTIGSAYKISVKAADPESKALTYSFTSGFGSFSEQTESADGCSVVFTLKSVISGEPVLVRLAVTDIKKATVTSSINVGTGKLGPKLTINSIQTPYKGRIKSDDSTLFTFSSSSDGLYQIIEADAITDPKTIRVPFDSYNVTDGNASITLGGATYSKENYLKLSSGEGVKKIWVIFRDKNYHYDYNFLTVTVDDTAPISTSTPNDGGTVGTITPKIIFSFNEEIDVSTHPTITFKKNGTVTSTPTLLTAESTQLVYDPGTLESSKNGSSFNYSVTISDVKDIAGNTMSDFTISFTIVENAYKVTFDAQGGSPTPSAQTIIMGFTATEPTNPSNGTFSFTGWYTDTTYTTKWDFTTAITKNITLYARWQIKCTLTFSVTGKTGGTIPSTTYYYYGDSVTLNSFSSSTGNLIKQEATKASRIAKWTDGTNTYNEGDTVSLGSSNVALTGIWEEYKVGDPGPAGGWVFYDGGSYTVKSVTCDSVTANFSWRYMESTKNSICATHWYIGSGVHDVSGTAIGDGYYNTWELYNSTVAANIVGNNPASYVCWNYTTAGYNNWFLPSSSELNILYTNIRDKIEAKVYWSSTELITGVVPYRYSDFAYYEDFSNGNCTYYSKTDYHDVLAVRMF